MKTKQATDWNSYQEVPAKRIFGEEGIHFPFEKDPSYGDLITTLFKTSFSNSSGDVCCFQDFIWNSISNFDENEGPTYTPS